MYVRPSSIGARSIKLPENYSGNAFSSHSPYSDMPPPVRTPQSRGDIPHDTSVRQEIEEISNTVEDEISTRDAVDHGGERRGTDVATEIAPTSSLFSSLLPRADLSSHFPFGHGIGSEELLILAVMLMVFLSGNEKGEVDSEFLLFLGLLLFAG